MSSGAGPVRWWHALVETDTADRLTYSARKRGVTDTKIGRAASGHRKVFGAHCDEATWIDVLGNHTLLAGDDPRPVKPPPLPPPPLLVELPRIMKEHHATDD